MRHNIVPYLGLMRGSGGIANVVYMRAHLVELFIADAEAPDYDTQQPLPYINQSNVQLLYISLAAALLVPVSYTHLTTTTCLKLWYRKRTSVG